MKHIEFNLTTVTPVFMAGEDGEHFELRPPSFKGLLRFWWRAYFWGNHPGDTSPKDIQHQMMQQEGDLFGTASDNGRKSRFAIRVSPTQFQGTKDKLPRQLLEVQSRGRKFRINILEYLAYGTYHYERGQGNVFERERLPENTSFSVMLKPSRGVNVRELVTSVYFLTVFGGIGAKSHNGFGSLAVTNPEVFKPYNLPYPFPDKEFLKNECARNPKRPPFTAFSPYPNTQGRQGMKIFKLKHSPKTWDDCLAQLGIIYREARGRLERKHEYKKRQYISAPIIAGKRQMSFSDRHAKPYFLRVVKTGAGFDGYILYLPSEYSKGVPQKGGSNEEHTSKFLKYCDELNQLLAINMTVYYG